MNKLEHAKRSIMEADSRAEEQEAWARYEKEKNKGCHECEYWAKQHDEAPCDKCIGETHGKVN